MPTDNTPALAYTLEPLLQSDGHMSALRVEVAISGPALSSQDILLTSPVEIAKVDVGRVENGLIAHDDNGPLELLHEVEPLGPPIVYQKWRVNRPTSGLVTASYVALPREVNASTKNAPSFDLRQNYGGLLGSGFGFLAVPPTQTPTRLYNTSIKWDLSNAPAQTRSVWTWGEGSGPISKTLEPIDIAATYFMVGVVDSFVRGKYGVYWLGAPPFNTAELSDRMYQLYQSMSTYFRDDEETYRVFIRYNPFKGSMAGTALKRSFMFSYDDEDIAHPRDFDDYLLFLAHECVHTWVHLCNGVSDNWYSEGMAEYYSIFLSHRAGLLSLNELRSELNKRLTMYYTNPLVNYSNAEVAKLTWKLSDAQRIPYGRGLAFILKIDALVSSNSDRSETASVDTLVLDLLQRSRDGIPFGIDEFVSILGSMLKGGKDEARNLYDSMRSGSTVIPPISSLAQFDMELIREDAPVWELGFDESQAIQGDRIISNLVPGSAAAMSGLQEGDRILNQFRLDDMKSDIHAKLDLTIERNNAQTLSFSFRPRGRTEVERWLYQDKLQNHVTSEL